MMEDSVRKNQTIEITAPETPTFTPLLVTSVHGRVVCKCGSGKTIKAGLAGKKQRYQCRNCRQRFVQNPVKFYYSSYKKKTAIRLYLEGLGIRSIARYMETSHVSVQKWIRAASKKLKVSIPTKADIIEIDELYYFLKKKKCRRWVWLAICRKTKRILAFQTGSRSKSTLKKLTNKIKLIHCSHYYTDEHVSFKGLLPKTKYTASKKFTYTVEGINSALRHFLARFRRRTKCYCKSEVMLQHTLNLFSYYYNC